MTKSSAEILGLPVISITEGRELGISKTLVVDARRGAVAAITIEDEDWYRGVKLLPYTSVIAIGKDAVTVTSSESILTLEEELEAMRDSLEMRKLLDRAKGILMQAHGISEDEAYRRLQRYSMEKRRPLKDVAAAVVQAGTKKRR